MNEPNAPPSQRAPWTRRAILGLLTALALLPALSRLPSAAEPPPSRYVVKVVGREFDWHFQVLEPTSQQSPIDSDRLHLPLNAEVELQITSDDYVYALRIPEWDVNEVAVPGMLRTARVRTEQPLDRVLPVDTMCGFAAFHDDVMGHLVVDGNQP